MIGTFKKLLLVSAMVAATGLSVVGYWVALLDWIKDTRTGVYATHHLEALGETFALVLYTFLAVRFLRNRIRLF